MAEAGTARKHGRESRVRKRIDVPEPHSKGWLAPPEGPRLAYVEPASLFHKAGQLPFSCMTCKPSPGAPVFRPDEQPSKRAKSHSRMPITKLNSPGWSRTARAPWLRCRPPSTWERHRYERLFRRQERALRGRPSSERPCGMGRAEKLGPRPSVNDSRDSGPGHTRPPPRSWSGPPREASRSPFPPGRASRAAAPPGGHQTGRHEL